MLLLYNFWTYLGLLVVFYFDLIFWFKTNNNFIELYQFNLNFK